MRFDAGFVMIPRRFWAILADAPEAWTKMLLFIFLNANIRPGVFKGRTILPGQIARSLASFAQECGISVQQARNTLDNMRATGLATIETTSQYTVVTILDWGTYSGSMDGEQQAEEQGKQHGSQQASNTLGNNDKKNKELRSKERGAKFSPPSPAEVTVYAAGRGHLIDGHKFCDFYESKGWMVGRSPMKNWQGSVRTWQKREQEDGRLPATNRPPDPEPQYVKPTVWTPPEDEPDYDLGPNGELIEIPKNAKAVTRGRN